MRKNIITLITFMLVSCVLLTLVSCEKPDTDTSLDVVGTESDALVPDTSAIHSTQDMSTETEPEMTDSDTYTTPTEVTGSETESEMTDSDISTTAPTEETNSEDNPQLDKTLALLNPNTVLLDSNGVKLTALDFGEQTRENYVTIDVQIENKNDHDVYIMLNSLTVNGYIVSGMLEASTTKAGTNQISSFVITKKDIEFAKIDEIREIIVSLYVKDANFDMFILPVEPVSLKTTKFDTPAPELDLSGVQVYNDNDILIIVKEGLVSDSRYMRAKLFIKNSSDSKISVSCTKLLVNGKEITNCNRIRYGRVPGGIISYNSLDIEKRDLEALGIQEIETIEMTLKVSSEYTLIAENLNVTVNYN